MHDVLTTADADALEPTTDSTCSHKGCKLLRRSTSRRLHGTFHNAEHHDRGMTLQKAHSPAHCIVGVKLVSPDCSLAALPTSSWYAIMMCQQSSYVCQTVCKARPGSRMLMEWSMQLFPVL